MSRDRPGSELNQLIESVHSGHDQEISRVHFGVIQIDEYIFSLSPFVSRASLDEFDVQFFLPRGRFGSEQGNPGVFGGTAQVESDGHDEIGEDMLEFITDSVDFETELLDDFHLISGHFFECDLGNVAFLGKEEFVPVHHGTDNVGVLAFVVDLALGGDGHGHASVFSFEMHCNFLETVIFTVVQHDIFNWFSVETEFTNWPGSEFEEISFLSL